MTDYSDTQSYSRNDPPRAASPRPATRWCPGCDAETLPTHRGCPWCDTPLLDLSSPTSPMPNADDAIEIPSLIASRQISLPAG